MKGGFDSKFETSIISYLAAKGMLINTKIRGKILIECGTGSVSTFVIDSCLSKTIHRRYRVSLYTHEDWEFPKSDCKTKALFPTRDASSTFKIDI